MKIALISCTKLKQTYNCTAEKMYQPSTLFSKALAYVKKQNYDATYILSAKHGLLPLDEMIAPYNVTLNNMSAQEVKNWSLRVLKDLYELDIMQIDFYAGEKYRKYLIPKIESKGIVCNVPLQGLGIGEQLQFYTKALM